MALTETSFVAGLATFLFYGLLPLALLLWLFGTPERRRRRARAARQAEARVAEVQEPAAQLTAQAPDDMQRSAEPSTAMGRDRSAR